MKQEIIEKIEIPEGIELEVHNGTIKLKSGSNENKKHFSAKGISISKDGNLIVLGAEKAGRKEKKLLYTIKAHIKNMIKGINENFEYKLEVAYVHFPMTVDYNSSTHTLNIKNFLGEKKPRSAKVLPGVDVKVDKNIITVKSNDIESAGQTATNFEKATQVRNKDRRKFQDGIFIISKPKRRLA